MADSQLIVTTKRLRTDLLDLRRALRKRYGRPLQQVVSSELRKRCTTLAESWLTDISRHRDIAECVSSKYLADLNVHFQRLLLCAERATLRRRYDEEFKAILKNYTARLVIPLLQCVGRPNVQGAAVDPRPKPANNGGPESFKPTAFVGHSFTRADLAVAESFIRILEAVGITVATGEKPAADKISEKVKRRIEKQHIFVGIFTRRDKLAGKNKWNTSAWVIDEKAYAYGKNKKLVLLKEVGVESIGGIQGDYEFIEFSRDRLQDALLGLLQLFSFSVQSMRD
jgi:hypothetical protein